MTREETKAIMPIIQAYAEGKVIQYSPNMGNTWYDVAEDVNHDFNINIYEYRIKPEPTYRPYHNLKECFRDMKNHEPFGYIRQKQKGDLELVVGTLYDEHEYLKLSVSCISQLNTVFERYTYFDGTPFGVKKEG